MEARVLPGTDGGNYPFWSPDSRFVGFSSDGKLKKMDITGGPAQILCNVGPSAPTTGNWTPEGMIYFANGRDGIFRVSQAGGEPTRITKVDGAAGETFHAYPHLLADGRHMLILVSAGTLEKNEIWRISLDGKEKKPVMKTNRSFAYVPPRENETMAHLLVMRQ